MTPRPGSFSRSLSALTFFFLSTLAVAGADAANVSREVTLPPGSIQVVETDGRHRITVDGSVSIFGAGEPDLPAMAVTLALDGDARASRVRVIPLETELLPGRYRLEGAAEPDRPGTPVAIDADIAGLDGWYPAEPLLGSEHGRMRGRDLSTVSVSPLSWNPRTGEVRVLRRFRVEIDTADRAPRAEDVRLQRESRTGRTSFDPLLADMTGLEIDRLPLRTRLAPKVNSGAPFAPTFRPSVDGSPVDMVIITEASQEPEYQRLADFRTQLGITTVVRTVSWIEANYPLGVDRAETIRLFIRDAVNQWGTAWVLLGGDTDIIPVRIGYTNFFGSEEIPTDLYYTALDGNWNADGDDVFGEGYGGVNSTGDSVDLFPDVWTGRLPTENVAEAEVLVDKILAYQETPPVGYQNDYTYLAEVLFPQTWVFGQTASYDGALHAEDIIDSTLVQHINTRYYENYTVWPGSIPENRPNALSAIDAGPHLLVHIGHGFTNTMSVGLNNGELKNADADNAANGDQTFFLYAINCTSCAIDFNCIGERYIKNDNGGAVSVIGSTRFDFPSTGRFYQDEFFRLLHRENVTRLGQTFALSKIPFIGFAAQDNAHRWTQFTHLYMGDPALSFWLDVPGTLSVSYAPTYTLGDGSFSVTVQDGGSPVEGAEVTLFKDGDAYTVGTTDVSGIAVVPFDPETIGDFSVGVWDPAYLPHRGASTVVAPGGSAFLYAQSQDIDDDTSGSSDGNVDSRIDAGETVELDLVLANSGGAGASGISATLTAIDPGVTVIDNSASYPNIGAGGSSSPTDGFVVEVDHALPDRTEARMLLDINEAGGNRSEEIILYVHAPVIEYRSQAVRDSVGNGNDNGVITNGEDFILLAAIRNIGLGEIRNAELRLRSNDGAVTIVDSVTVLGDVAPGDIGSNPADGFRLSLNPVLPEPELTLVVVDAYGELTSHPLDINAPDQVIGVTGFGMQTTIRLAWSVLDEADLWGYAVYRSPTEIGPFERVNTWTAEGSAVYEDTGLPPLTRYYYQVAGIDFSGNEGPRSPVTSATTSLPNAPNWPISLGTATTGGVTIADLDGDTNFDVVAGGEEIYALTYDGQDFYNGDADIRTLGPLTNIGSVRFWNQPAVGDIDGDGINEIAAISWDDAKIHVVDLQGNPKPGFPKNVNPLNSVEPNPLGSVVFADVDADGDREIFCQVARVMFAWHHDGTELIDGDANGATNGVVAIAGSSFSYGSPTVANIDGEPLREIIYPMRDGKVYVFQHDGTPYPGFPFVTGGNITASVAVGDIDKDGNVEMIIASSSTQIHALRADLTQATGFPVGALLNGDTDSSPALGDINGDTYPDVVIGTSNGEVRAWSGQNGAMLPNFPVDIEDALGNPVPVLGSAALADVDNDGRIDIVIGDELGRLHGIDRDGNPLPGFPIQTGNNIQNGAAIWDVDGDGLTEVLVQSFDQRIYNFETPWAFNPALAPWPMFKANQMNTGVLNEGPFEVVGTDDTALPPTIQLQNFPNPFRLATTIRYQVPDSDRSQGVDLRIFDLQGRVLRTLVDDVQRPGAYELQWDGRDEFGRTVAAGIYPYRLEVGGRSLSRKLILLR